MKNLKVVGGILMMLGTSVGAGMLALPIASANDGYVTTIVLLIATWSIMTFGALLILEVTTWLPENTNLISMSRFTLGKPGQIISWISYLLLGYSLLCAYISGNSDILQGLITFLVSIEIPRWTSTVLVVLLFGYIVYRGIYSVDIVNRLLMGSKIILYLLLILIIAPHINTDLLLASSMPKKIHIDTIMVMITSFGFAIIIPSLRSYFKSDDRKLRLVVLFGSLIPLVIYIVWISLIQGILTSEELSYLANSKNAITELSNLLYIKLHNYYLVTSIRCFTSICAATSFLGVALCLCDFLTDGMKLNKNTIKGSWVYIVTFIPPLLVVLFAPNAFIVALSYAGIFCIILLTLLPALMVWKNRKTHGKKILLSIQIIASLGVLSWEVSKHILGF